MTTGVALVGCGLVGTKRALALPADCELISIHDVDAQRALALAEASAHKPTIQTSLDALVASSAVDLVIVATPHNQLGEVTIQALHAGHDVLVEKPGAHTLDSVLDIQAAVSATGRTVRVGFNHRFHPAIRRVREIVEEGAFGPVMGIRGRYGHGGRLGYEREWRVSKAISGGGELIDQGMHLIDLTRCVLGDVTLAFAELQTAFWPMEVEDNAYLALRGTVGGFAWLHASWTDWKNLFSFEVALERAKLEVSGLGGSYGEERLTVYEMAPEMGPPKTTTFDWPGPDTSWHDELVDVLAGLRGERAFGATLDDCEAAHRIADEAYQQ